MSTNPITTIWNILFKPEETAKYLDDPTGYLAETGLDQCDAGEVHDLVVMAYEKGPVNQGASVNVAPAPVPAPPMDPTLPAGKALEQTVNYYVNQTTTTYVDDRDTNIDSSVNTQIHAGDHATIDLDIDNETNTASGDGAVAAGEIDDSLIATGDVTGSVLANDSDLENTVVGDDNVQINAGGGTVDLDNVTFGDGSGIDNSRTHVDNSVDNSVNDSFNTDNSVTATDSFNDDSINVAIEDSFNDQSVTVEDSFNDDSVNDSFNTDVDVDLDVSL